MESGVEKSDIVFGCWLVSELEVADKGGRYPKVGDWVWVEEVS